MFIINNDERARWKITSRLQQKPLLMAINCLAGLAIFFFGYDQGMMGGVNDSAAYVKRMGLGYANNDSVTVTNTLLQGGIVSVYYLGTLVGCFLGGHVSDRYGRIKSLGFGATWGIVGAALQCTAMNPPWMIVARLINGIGTGVLNATVPVYGSELADYESRGQFIAMEFTLNIAGVAVAYWLGFGLSYIDNGNSDFQWRFPIAFQILFLLLLVTGCWMFPESPRYLCMVGRRDEALYVLRRLRGTENGVAMREMREIEATVEMEKESGDITYFHMLFGLGKEDLHIARRVQLVIWLQILQSWSGIAGVTMYAPTIFQIAGFDSHKTMWISGLNDIFYALSTLVCVFTLDRIGRRWTLWWGAAGQAIAMFLAGGLAQGGLTHRDNQGPWGIAATSMVYLYTFIFGATWLTVPWLYPAEIFPLKVRAKGNAWGVAGWSLGNGSLTLALPYIFASVGANTLHVFGAVNLISIPIVWAFYPESSRRTLEKIDLLFAAKSPWAWTAEANFNALMADNPALGVSVGHGGVEQVEKGLEVETEHQETI
ncbi:general substrate transporter [Aspergillus sclerotiicarbonarius CBS 121057]|uniref:General substrate transporter n=1 Tax=Aspergillus sclerotiicarbonarius (strain CBS 121057 / IBT 28362) TaxID=1448318 RepID=A0A319EA57_ASPSB|nr:general substrate transporter [Aspergillus sclerotiicarbonarius CBS 121057]